MQWGRSAANSFPQLLNLNQSSPPENTSMDHSPSINCNANCINSAHAPFQSSRHWEHGETSCAANNSTRLGWFSSPNEFSGLESGSVDCSSPPPNTNDTSNSASISLNSNHWQSWNHRAVPPHNIFISGHSAMEPENYDSAPCKRKALEGSSRQFYPGGSSSSNELIDNSIRHHSAHGFYTTSSNLNISSSNLVEHVNPSSEVGMNRVDNFTPSPFPTLSFQAAGSVGRHYEIRYNNHGRNEPDPFDTPIITPFRRELRPSVTLPTNQSNPANQPRLMPVNESRGTHPYPWNGSSNLRGSGSSIEEFNVRSLYRNNLDYLLLPDQVDWSYPLGSRIGSVNQAHSDVWSPYQHPTSENHQRLSESCSWIPFHRVESESGTRSHFSHMPSSGEAVSSSRHHLDQRSAFLMDDDVNGWHSLTAVEGRHRLV